MSQIIEGDCLVELAKLPAESIDLVVTDPPYGYSFMGKDWDKAVPSVDVWRGCHRVLKPGAFAFVMSSPRQDVLSHMIVNLGDAGFRTDFTSIYWTYASGFPKACNVSKAVDKRLGVEREILGKRTDGRYAYGFSDKATMTSFAEKVGGSAGFNPDKVGIVTASATPEAKQLDGSYGGFQPKPALEVVIVAMKPLSEKTFVEQALKNGHGCTWLDNARIPFQSKEDFKDSNRPNCAIKVYPEQAHNAFGTGLGYNKSLTDPKGRFPANLLVSDDILNDGVERISKYAPSNIGFKNQNIPFRNEEGKDSKEVCNSFVGDSGSFSRYFSLDNWFTKQLKTLPAEVQKTYPFLLTPKASKSERNKGLENISISQRITFTAGRGLKCKKCGHWKNSGSPCVCVEPEFEQILFKRPINKNSHPTVKPLQLMTYLITLGSRPNDLVLDLFAGSGTTCLAAKMLNRRSIGIELDPEYIKIARARVNGHNILC